MKTYLSFLIISIAASTVGQTSSNRPAGGGSTGFTTQPRPTPQSPASGTLVQSSGRELSGNTNRFATNQFGQGSAGLLSTGSITTFGSPGTPAATDIGAVISNLRVQIEQALPILAAATIANASLPGSGSVTSVTSATSFPTPSAGPVGIGDPIAGGTDPSTVSPGRPSIRIGEQAAAPGGPGIAPGQPMRALPPTGAADGSTRPIASSPGLAVGSDPQALQWIVVLQNDLQRILPLLQALDASGLGASTTFTNQSRPRNEPTFYTNDFGIQIDNSRMPTINDSQLTPTGR
jgi:hypothetical protein